LEFAHAQNQPLIFKTFSKDSSGGVCSIHVDIQSEQGM
jgi:hypothetical protein